MSETVALYQLLTWSSTGYPNGTAGSSHGLEWAVRTESVTSLAELIAYVSVVISRGGGWLDAVLFTHAWRVAEDSRALDDLCEVASTLCATTDNPFDNRTGTAFLQVTCNAWPHRTLDAFAARQMGRQVTHSVVVALACAVHGIALEPALHAYLHAEAANLVAAGARLMHLGQTEARIAVAQLGPVVDEVSKRALSVSLQDLEAGVLSSGSVGAGRFM